MQRATHNHSEWNNISRRRPWVVCRMMDTKKQARPLTRCHCCVNFQPFRWVVCNSLLLLDKLFIDRDTGVVFSSIAPEEESLCPKDISPSSYEIRPDWMKVLGSLFAYTGSMLRCFAYTGASVSNKNLFKTVLYSRKQFISFLIRGGTNTICRAQIRYDFFHLPWSYRSTGWHIS